MKLNFNKKQKSFIVAAVIVILFIVIIAFSLNNRNVKSEDNNKKQNQENSEQQQGEKNTPTVTLNPTNNPTNEPNTSEENMDDVQIESEIDQNDNYSIKSKLTGKEGKYSIEKLSNGDWIKIMTEVSYSGTGKLEIVDNIPVNETERTYRIYRVLSGKVYGPKEITIDRNLIVTNGGANKFPGALWVKK